MKKHLLYFPFALLLFLFISINAKYGQEALNEKKEIPQGISRIYLKNGENIEGKIIRVNDDTLTIESNKNYGILTIPKRDIIIIEFPHSQVKLNRRYGLGYMSKNYIISAIDNTLNYNVSMLSLKTYFNDDNFALQWFAGYGSATVRVLDASRDGCTDRTNSECLINRKYHVFQAGLRGAFTLHKQQNALLYFGMSAGVISLKNDTEKVDEAGGLFSLFIGTELFFNQIPNFGFSGEVSFDVISTSSITRTELNVSPFPLFSVHYYF